MDRQQIRITGDQMTEQARIAGLIRGHYQQAGARPLAFVDTYGCQQNEADSERIRGMLESMGFGFTDREELSDVIVINTCAVREHAEQRVFGNVGHLVHSKRKKPGQVICVCGCMVQQERVAEKIRESFRHVDLVFGPHSLWKFPELLYRVLSEGGRVFSVESGVGNLAEGIPVKRSGNVKAWLSVMYGCNNFCTYCVVPHVRGRERSRRPEDILTEARQLAESGCREITLLGQNVNSYGRDLEEGVDFSTLLEQINEIPGDFLIRFMTSHPKDASKRLFDTMAGCEKAARQLHLPFQAGNARVLKAMNRGYTPEHYLELIAYARSVMPELVLTSDVIVGFPGETDSEFEDTLKLVETVEFDALFTFLYSPREGTPAAEMPDPHSRAQKQERFDRLLELQNRVSAEKHARYIGKTLRVLVDGQSGDERYPLTARTEGNRLVRLAGSVDLVGKFVPALIDGGGTWSLTGKAVDC